MDSQGGRTVERSKEERRACASIGEKKRRERARAGMDQGVFCCLLLLLLLSVENISLAFTFAHSLSLIE